MLRRLIRRFVPNLHPGASGDGRASVCRFHLHREHDASRGGDLGGDLGRSQHGFADQHRSSEHEVLPEIQCMLAGNSHADKLREQRREEHAVHDALAELGLRSVFGIDVQRAVVAAQLRETFDFVLRKRVLDLEGVTFVDVRERQLRSFVPFH